MSESSYGWNHDPATTFFSELMEAAHDSQSFGFTQDLRELDKIICRSPSRRNLEKIVNLWDPNAPTHETACLKQVAAAAWAIIEGKFRKEFRYRYGGDALGSTRITTYGRGSATSCLFSEIRQALTYPAYR